MLTAILCISRYIVQRAKERFCENKNYTKRVRLGMKQRTTAQDDHFLTQQVLRNRNTTAISAQNSLKKV